MLYLPCTPNKLKLHVMFLWQPWSHDTFLNTFIFLCENQKRKLPKTKWRWVAPLSCLHHNIKTCGYSQPSKNPHNCILHTTTSIYYQLLYRWQLSSISTETHLHGNGSEQVGTLKHILPKIIVMYLLHDIHCCVGTLPCAAGSSN
jgi:hypothetical protein